MVLREQGATADFVLATLSDDDEASAGFSQVTPHCRDRVLFCLNCAAAARFESEARFREPLSILLSPFVCP